MRQRRLARQQALRSASEHLIGTPEDLEKALTANAVFWNKVATHDLLTATLKESGKYLAMVTQAQLQHGSDRVALERLLPAEAAEIIAAAFFDFVL